MNQHKCFHQIHLYYYTISYLFRGCINKQTELFPELSSKQLSQDIDFALVLHPQLDAWFSNTEIVTSGDENCDRWERGPVLGTHRSCGGMWTFVFYYGTRMEPSIFDGFGINS